MTTANSFTGDKETFWIGWELVGDLEYAFHQGDAGIMGEPQDPEEERKKRKEKKKQDDDDHDHDDSDHDPDHDDSQDSSDSSSDTSKPENYTVCAPQLLHLDNDGKPLWFNGWLLDNKFAERREKKFGNFDYYLVEPRGVREPTAWQLHENNQCCLTTDADKTFKFSDKEKALLKRMMDKAKEVGAPGGE